MKSRLLVAGYLLLVSVLVRLPFFFVDVINWDESTLILMGQSILDGHLAYTELWDLKPPLAFVSYALFMILWGKSILSIRIGGTLCVALTSWFLYLIGKHIWSDRVGIFAGTLFILLSALLPGGQATMTEHVALVPLIGALTLLLIKKPTPVVLFGTGMFLAIASLIRLNLAYVAILVGFWLLFRVLSLKIVTIGRLLAYAVGSFAVVWLTYIPYLVTGNGRIWLDSVIFAPLSYSSSQKSLWQAFQAQINFILSSISPLQEIDRLLPPSLHLPKSLLPVVELPIELIGISWLVWSAGMLGIITLAVRWKTMPPTKQQELLLLGIFFLGTVISIIKSGAAFYHYLIQLVPFFALTAAVFWHILMARNRFFLTTLAIAFFSAVSLQLIFVQYQIIGDRLLAGQPLTYGAGYEIANYLERENPTKEPVYLMSDHIVYWFTDLKPLSKSTTHPSNISREYLLKILVGSDASTETELAGILAQKPKFIIKKRDFSYIEEDTPARLLLEETLATQYQLVKEIPVEETFATPYQLIEKIQPREIYKKHEG